MNPDETQQHTSRHGIIASTRRAVMRVLSVIACITLSHTLYAASIDIEAEATASDTLRVETKTNLMVADYPSATADSLINIADSYSLTPDSTHLVSIATDTRTEVRKEEPKWWQLMLRNKFDTHDTSIPVPRFIRFCLDVYNLADRIFNSYDSDYVEGTGRRWKAYLKNDNLLDSYAMHITKDMPIRMMSNVTSNIGPYIQYMAVSVGYQWDMSNLIGGQPQNQKRVDAAFTCARFSAELFYWNNTGGNVIRTFGKYNNGHLIHVPISGVSMDSFGVDVYYFFNNRKYSQTAAYGFGKIQKRSQGSFIAGFSYGYQAINIDFNTLPAHLLPYLTINPAKYNFHYKNYCLMVGYGYNLVFAKNFLFNVTAIPSLGLNHCYEDSIEGEGDLLSMNIKGRTSLTYNYRDLFAGITMKMDGHWYRSGAYSLFNATETLSACIGWRF